MTMSENLSKNMNSRKCFIYIYGYSHNAITIIHMFLNNNDILLLGLITTGALVNKCTAEGDMYYETRGDTCWICGCFTGFGGLFPKCAPCTCSSKYLNKYNRQS